MTSRDAVMRAAARARAFLRRAWSPHLCWGDVAGLVGRRSPAGRRRDDPLAALGVRPGDHLSSGSPVRFAGKTRYLNAAHAVVTHTVDDSSPYVPACLDAIDRYGIKATVFVNTAAAVMPQLWPRLREAVANGHEIGAHSRRHRCRTPETFAFCLGALSRFEIDGSRRDILAHTDQPYVWTWAYPCGNCADRRFVQRRVAAAGYLAARAYPGERRNRHLVPDLNTYDANPYAARYTQVVQKGRSTTEGSSVPGRTDVPALNAKFDEVYAASGIYSFVSHPQMLDYGAEGFYERHLAHVGGRDDVWYVPMGPLYAYRALSEDTSVQALKPDGARARFAVTHRLTPTIYNGSITLAFQTSTPVRPVAGGEDLPERAAGPVRRWTGQYYRRAGDLLLLTIQPNTIVEFR